MDGTLWIQLLSAFVVGLLGGAHCVAMCGGIVGALTFGLPRERRQRLGDMLPFQLAYNLGRILGYSLAGGLMGGVGLLLAGVLPLYYAQQALFGLAGLFMIALGLYLAGWWRGLNRLEAAGGLLWRRLEPLGRRLLPVTSPARALLLGLVWGWLPCGLVYSVLVWAVASGGVLPGAALLLAFGLGTLPTLLAMSLLAGGIAHWSRNPWVARGAGCLVMGFGAHALWRVWGHPITQLFSFN